MVLVLVLRGGSCAPKREPSPKNACPNLATYFVCEGLPLVGGFFPPPDNQPDVIKDELGKKVCQVIVPSTAASRSHSALALAHASQGQTAEKAALNGTRLTLPTPRLSQMRAV